MKLDGKETLLKKSLHNYFDKKEEEIKLIRNILNSVDRISLRILDWFVTNYSKKNNTTIGSIYVYNSYKSQLKAYSKKFFDPFCRRETYASKEQVSPLGGETHSRSLQDMIKCTNTSIAII